MGEVTTVMNLYEQISNSTIFVLFHSCVVKIPGTIRPQHGGPGDYYLSLCHNKSLVCVEVIGSKGRFHILSISSYISISSSCKTEEQKEVEIGLSVCMNVSSQQWSEEAGLYGGRNP